MKRFMVLLLTFIIAFAMVGCGSEVDYDSISSFESALNDGDDVEGKTVEITVDEFVPDSAFGYNIQTGEHLNFCSLDNPGVKEGDTLIVKVTDVESVLGSFIIYYEKV